MTAKNVYVRSICGITIRATTVNTTLYISIIGNNNGRTFCHLTGITTCSVATTCTEDITTNGAIDNRCRGIAIYASSTPNV